MRSHSNIVPKLLGSGVLLCLGLGNPVFLSAQACPQQVERATFNQLLGHRYTLESHLNILTVLRAPAQNPDPEFWAKGGQGIAQRLIDGMRSRTATELPLETADLAAACRELFSRRARSWEFELELADAVGELPNTDSADERVRLIDLGRKMIREYLEGELADIVPVN